MQRTSAQVGWEWVKQGIAYFRKQPMEFSLLFLGYLFLIFAIVILPFIGRILFFLVVPAISFGFLQACAYADQGKRVSPRLLFAAFRSPGLRSLLALGSLYFLAAYLALAVSQLVDGGLFWNVMHGNAKLDAELARQSNLPLAIQFAGVVYTVILLPLWYAAPLIVWKNMGVMQAIFYSGVAVWRNLAAFFVYGVAWLLINVFVGSIISMLVVILFGQTIAFILLSAFSIVVTAAMYCSFYPTYTYVFGAPFATEDATE